MTDHPSRRLVTLGNLNRASSTIIALQLATGAAVAILLYCAGRWLIVGGPFIGEHDGVETAGLDVAVLAAILVAVFSSNLLGLFMFRVLAYLWRRLRRPGPKARD